MRALYDSKSKSISSRGIDQLLSKEAKIESWLKVEAALALSQGEVGFIPMEAAKNIVENCKIEKIDFEEIDRIQTKVGHGFVLFLKVLIKQCSEEGGKYVHYGVTTQNIQQTGQIYIIKQINDIYKDFIGNILMNLAKLAKVHDKTVMSGRTRGKHTIPITYGYKVSVWISELLNVLERIEESEKRVFQVMIGGGVGAFNATGKVGYEVQIISSSKIRHVFNAGTF